MHLSRVCVVLATVALALVAAGSALATAVAPAAKAKVSWAGTWNVLDHGTAGRAAGNDYTWSVTLTQSGSTIRSIGTPTPYTVEGTASGRSATFTVVGCCNYTGEFKVTLSEDGQRFTGKWTDVQGNAGTAVGTRSTEPPPDHTLSGTVLEQTCVEETCTRAGLAGVTVRATGGPGGPEETVTGADGTYSLTLGQGSWKVTPTAGGRVFQRLLPSGDGDGEPSARVDLGADTAGVDFATCAAAERSPQLLAKGRSPICRKIKVEIVRVFGKGWTQKVGKSFIPRSQPRVGFTRPGRNGEFTRRCVSGCVNLRIRVTDATTHKPLPNAIVHLKARVDGPVVEPDAIRGVFCKADLTKPLGAGCDEEIDIALDHKRDADAYYWIPGLVEGAPVQIDATVSAPGYSQKGTARATVNAKPNVAFHSTYTMSAFDARFLNLVAPVTWALGAIDLANYCGLLASGLVTVAGAPMPPALQSILLDATKALNVAAKDACGVAEAATLIPKAKLTLGWALYVYFLDGLGIPGNGLVGTPRLWDVGAQWLLNFAGFYDAFLNAQKGYVYADYDPEKEVGRGDVMDITIYEVSSRVPTGFGVLKNFRDALYLRMGGTRAHEQITAPAEAFVEGGYWPGCWLDPELNRVKWWAPVGANPCKTDDL